MISINRLVNFGGILLFCFLLKTGILFSQSETKNSVDSKKFTNKTNLNEITLKLKRNAGFEKRFSEAQDVLLLKNAGVRYVGVDYVANEIVIRYDIQKIGKLRILDILRKKYENRVHIIEDVQNPTQNLSTNSYQNDLKLINSIITQVHFECLARDDAHAICKQLLPVETLEKIDLDKCLVVKVDFKIKQQGRQDFDWQSQACLIDENEYLIKPLNWLELPLTKEHEQKELVSGILIFPKIPLLKLGLTLRLLRANGEGYDSFFVDLPYNEK